MDNRISRTARRHLRSIARMPRFMIGVLTAVVVAWMTMLVSMMGWQVMFIPVGLYLIYVVGAIVQRVLQRLETWLDRDQG